jgi:hypothetical protein
MFEELPFLPRLKTIHLSNQKLTSLKGLSKYHNLEVVSVMSCPIKVDCWTHLYQCRQSLTSLYFDRTSINDESIPYIEKLDSLVVIGCGGTKITENGIRRLSRLPKIRSIYAYETQYDRSLADELFKTDPAFILILNPQALPWD